MSLQDRARCWNVTADERAATYPCDPYLDGPRDVLMRGVDVGAPAEIAFRWLCQLKVGPYSYNPFGRRDRRSPRELTAGVEVLAEGQDLLVFRIVEFEPNRHITGVARPEVERPYGPMAATHAVVPTSTDACRFVVKCNIGTVGLGRAG